METDNMVQARVSTGVEMPASAERQAPAAAGPAVACPMCPSSGSPSQIGVAWLAKHRGWVLLGSAAVGGTGVALGAGWITVGALAPLLYAAPCAIMMLFCMKGMMGQGQQQAPDQMQNQAAPPPPAIALDVPRRIPELEKQA